MRFNYATSDSNITFTVVRPVGFETEQCISIHSYFLSLVQGSLTAPAIAR